MPRGALPTARERDARELARLHLVDGDGSSICGRWAPNQLVVEPETPWRGVSRSNRCVPCAAFYSAWTGST